MKRRNPTLQAAIAALLSGTALSAAATPGDVTRISEDAAGNPGNNTSYSWSGSVNHFSADGRYVAFTSEASSLGDGDGDTLADIHVYDRQTGAVHLMSRRADGVKGNSDSYYPAMAPDGSLLAFSSYATNLDGPQNNSQVFVKETGLEPSGLNQSPAANAGADQTMEATSAAGAAVTLNGADSSDPDTGDSIASFAWSGPFGTATGATPVVTLPVGVHTVTLTVTDTHGATDDDTVSITVQDTTPPALNLPANKTAEATGPSGAAVNYPASASDLVDGNVAVSCSPASGSVFALGPTTVNCTARDSRDNTASGSFTVTVADTTPPVVTPPANVSLEATGPATAVPLGAASVTDAVSTGLTATPDKTGPFAVGVHTITWTATDAAGNTGSATQTVTVTDTKPPVLSLPANITKEATSPSGASVSFTASASDLVSGSVPVSCSPASGATFPLAGTTVNCSASDGAGNTATGSFTVTVADTTRPVVTAPANVSVEATGPATAVPLGAASVTDAVSTGLTATPDKTGPFAVGVHTITWTATDAAGNTGSATQTVTVTDTTPPALSCPANVTGIVGQAVSLGTPTVSDLADATPTVSNNAPASFGPGSATVTWTATDDSGNQATCQQTVSLSYNFQGFFQPVDNLPTLNTVKNGSTVPVKWRLLEASGALISDVATVTGSQYVPVACDNTSPEAVVETTVTGGTVLRWDSTAQQFVYNWKTPSLAGKCVRLNVMFKDGQTKSAVFKLK